MLPNLLNAADKYISSLSASITNSALIIPVNSVSGLNGVTAGQVDLDRGTSTEERVNFTSVSGNNLIVPVSGRGQSNTTAQSHNQGASVELVVSAVYQNGIVNMLLVQHNDDGTHKALSVPTGLLRQGLINSNFDKWQRGISFTSSQLDSSINISGNRNGYAADRWFDQAYSGIAGTGDYTITVSQQAFTLGQTAVPNEPKFYHRFNLSTLATLGTSTGMIRTVQKIEGVRIYAGQTVTMSIWAKADTNRTCGLVVSQNFGTGGSPSTFVTAGGSTINLTTSWQQFTLTCAIPSIFGKTLGTNNDDCIDVGIVYYKQDNNIYSLPSGAVGTHAIGVFDIAQAQINQGGTLLPYPVKSNATETMDCLRYFEKSYKDNVYAINNPSDEAGAYSGIASSATSLSTFVGFKVPKRTSSPSVTIYATDGTINSVSNSYSLGHATTGVAVGTNHLNENTFSSIVVTGLTGGNHYEFQYTCSAEIVN